jgi:hypothetical protein
MPSHETTNTPSVSDLYLRTSCCRYCQARYARGVEFGVPLDVASQAARATVPALAYIPPPLQDRSWGWYPEWQKIWEGWGMPTYAAA